MQFVLLFFEFFKIGLFAVGGGLATLPFIYELSAKTGWFTVQDIANLIAVSESTPGPLGVNMATYVGNITAGIPGGICATLGLITPSLIVIVIISKILLKFKESKTVANAFYGLRPASTGLIAAAGAGVFKLAMLNTQVFAVSGEIIDLFNIKAVSLGIILWLALKKFKKHPVVYICAAGIIGAIFNF